MSFSIRKCIIYVDTHFFLFDVYFNRSLIYFLQFLFLLFSTLSFCFCFVLVPAGKQGWCEHPGWGWTDRPDENSKGWLYSHLRVAIGTCLYQSKSECCYCCISIIIDICWYMLVYMDIHSCVQICIWIVLYVCLFVFHKNINVYIWMYESVYICMHIQSCMYLILMVYLFIV